MRNKNVKLKIKNIYFKELKLYILYEKLKNKYIFCFGN